MLKEILLFSNSASPSVSFTKSRNMDEPQKDIEQQLFDYYDGNLKGIGQYEVKSWINASEDNRKTARRIYSLLLASDMKQTQREIDTEKALKKVTGRRIAGQKKTGWWQWAQRVAAVLFLPLVGLLVWQQTLMDRQEAVVEHIEVRTNPGMTTRLTLPDGSIVYLNSGSSLSYPSLFTGETRDVRLSGEGYFEVAKDAGKRFLVHTPDHSVIRVYGTCFNVEAYPDDTNVITTLIEGEVGFIHDADTQYPKQVRLSPGQKLVYNTETQKLTRHTTTGRSELSWKDGMIIFDNTPLTEALRMLGKRFNVEFIVKDKQLEKDRFTGTFTTQRLEKILKYFEISSHIHWRYLNDPDINKEKIRIEIY